MTQSDQETTPRNDRAGLVNLSQKSGYLTAEAIAEYGHVTRHTIYLAVQRGRLRAIKINGRIFIKKSDYDDYRTNKFSRDFRTCNGKKVYDIDAGRLSPTHAAKLVGLHLKAPWPTSRIYYLIKSGELPAQKMAGVWVIKRDDLMKFISTFCTQLSSSIS